MTILELLKNHIDLQQVPFSERGSRLLVYRSAEKDSLSIKLAERLIFLDADIEAYLRRPPFVDDLCLLDACGEPLAFKITTWPHRLSLSTALGDFGIAFQDEQTISIGLPPGQAAGLRFSVDHGNWQAIQRGGQVSSYRCLSYQANTDLIRNTAQVENGSFQINCLADAGQDASIVMRISASKDTVEAQSFSQSVRQAARRWQDWFAQAPPVDARYQKTCYLALWVMANNLISPRGIIRHEGMAPSKTKYIGLWLWDSALHALALRHIDPALAQNQIRNMLAGQLVDGMLPDAIHDEGIVSEIGHPVPGRVTKPPILAWAAMKLYDQFPDQDFIREIYPPLTRWNAWWFNQSNINPDGLAQYHHPYSSGLDDSPLWDFGMPVISPDLNTYLYLQMSSLARMAEILGLPEEAQTWKNKAAALLEKMIANLWDEERGCFLALHAGQPLPVLTPFNLFPLWCGQLPPNMREKLMAHLTDESEFWREPAVPTVARNDARYNPDVMWRGPVWANINYFLIEALNINGETRLADELRRKTLDLIMAQPGIFEYYNAETGAPGAQAAPIFGWTAAVFIELAIQASRAA